MSWRKTLPSRGLQLLRHWLMLMVSVGALVGCEVNSPPLYGLDARDFLLGEGVEAELVDRLTSYEPLTEDEINRLHAFDHDAVLHLLGANLSTPPELLATLGGHQDLAVRTGVAGNPRTPMATLLSLRVPGRYDTVNLALSRNPMLPQSVLREIYDSGEAGRTGLARNPNLPEDLMRAIDQRGDSLDLSNLARNPNLPKDLLDKYLASSVPSVRNSARVNAQLDSRYRRPEDDMLGGP